MNKKKGNRDMRIKNRLWGGFLEGPIWNPTLKKKFIAEFENPFADIALKKYF